MRESPKKYFLPGSEADLGMIFRISFDPYHPGDLPAGLGRECRELRPRSASEGMYGPIRPVQSLFRAGPARPGPGRRGGPENHRKIPDVGLNVELIFFWLLRKTPFNIRVRSGRTKSRVTRVLTLANSYARTQRSARFAFQIRIALRRGGVWIAMLN